jgi:hypothetical protein
MNAPRCVLPGDTALQLPRPEIQLRRTRLGEWQLRRLAARVWGSQDLGLHSSSRRAAAGAGVGGNDGRVGGNGEGVAGWTHRRVRRIFGRGDGSADVRAASHGGRNRFFFVPLCKRSHLRSNGDKDQSY